MTPIDQLMDGVAWEPTGATAGDDGLPYATHSGVLEIFGKSMRCYRLNTGEAIFDANDFNAFWSELAD